MFLKSGLTSYLKDVVKDGLDWLDECLKSHQNQKCSEDIKSKIMLLTPTKKPQTRNEVRKRQQQLELLMNISANNIAASANNKTPQKCMPKRIKLKESPVYLNGSNCLTKDTNLCVENAEKDHKKNTVQQKSKCQPKNVTKDCAVLLSPLDSQQQNNKRKLVEVNNKNVKIRKVEVNVELVDCVGSHHLNALKNKTNEMDGANKRSKQGRNVEAKEQKGKVVMNLSILKNSTPRQKPLTRNQARKKEQQQQQQQHQQVEYTKPSSTKSSRLRTTKNQQKQNLFRQSIDYQRQQQISFLHSTLISEFTGKDLVTKKKASSKKMRDQHIKGNKTKGTVKAVNENEQFHFSSLKDCRVVISPIKHSKLMVMKQVVDADIDDNIDDVSSNKRTKPLNNNSNEKSVDVLSKVDVGFSDTVVCSGGSVGIDEDSHHSSKNTDINKNINKNIDAIDSKVSNKHSDDASYKACTCIQQNNFKKCKKNINSGSKNNKKNNKKTESSNNNDNNVDAEDEVEVVYVVDKCVSVDMRDETLVDQDSTYFDATANIDDNNNNNNNDKNQMSSKKSCQNVDVPNNNVDNKNGDNMNDCKNDDKAAVDTKYEGDKNENAATACENDEMVIEIESPTDEGDDDTEESNEENHVQSYLDIIDNINKQVVNTGKINDKIDDEDDDEDDIGSSQQGISVNINKFVVGNENVEDYFVKNTNVNATDDGNIIGNSNRSGNDTFTDENVNNNENSQEINIVICSYSTNTEPHSPTSTNMPSNVTSLKNNASAPVASNLTVTSPNYSSDRSNVNSYDMTPARKIYQKSTETDYNINDLASDDSSDDEDNPRKVIPSWAKGRELQRLIEATNCVPFDQACDYFSTDFCPNLAQIFPTSRKVSRLKRTSSAHWDTPPCKRICYNNNNYNN